MSNSQIISRKKRDRRLKEENTGQYRTSEMPSNRILIFRGLIALAGFFFILQFVGFKFFMDKVEKTPDNTPWDVVQTMAAACYRQELPVFVVEPSLLRALRVGESGLELWDFGRHSIVTFGVIEATVGELHNLLTALDSYIHLGINAPDPRDFSLLSKQNYRTVPSHYFLWHEKAGGPLIHLMVFYRRAGYYWHAAAASPRSTRPPVNASHLTFGMYAGAIDQFSITTEKVRGMQLSYPADTSAFIWQMQHGKFVECDYAKARHFYMKYGKATVDEGVEFRRTTRQLLSIVVKTLHGMEIPFWISSGTLLGWYRQCDVITYSKDVDIGINITDYRDELITGLELAGLALYQQFGKVSDSFELSFFYGNVKLDIFFFYDEKDYVWNGGTQASTGKKFKYKFSKFGLSWTEFLGLRVRVPDPALPYIQANYGPHWEIPVRDWDWKKSPANVAENGEWPPEERHEMIQLFEVPEKKEPSAKNAKEKLDVVHMDAADEQIRLELEESLGRNAHRDKPENTHDKMVEKMFEEQLKAWEKDGGGKENVDQMRQDVQVDHKDGGGKENVVQIRHDAQVDQIRHDVQVDHKDDRGKENVDQMRHDVQVDHKNLRDKESVDQMRHDVQVDHKDDRGKESVDQMRHDVQVDHKDDRGKERVDQIRHDVQVDHKDVEKQGFR